MQLLDPIDAWIDPTQRLLQQFQAPPLMVSTGRRPTVAVPEGSGSPFVQQGKQRRTPATAGSSKQSSADQALQQQQAPSWQEQQQEHPAVLSLSDVQREAAVFTAAAALQQKGSGVDPSALMRHELPIGWLFEQLVGQGLFSQSLQLAHAVYTGQQLLQQLEVAIAEVAGQCAELQRSSQQLGAEAGSGQQQEGFDDSGGMCAGSGGRGSSVLSTSVLTPVGPSYLSSDAAVAWSKLRRLLELYASFDCLSPGTESSSVPAAPGSSTAAGSSSTGWAGGSAAGGSDSAGSGNGITLVGARLRLAAIDGALSAQPRMALPQWLLQPFQPTADAAGMAGKPADPAALLRKLMEHWRLVDAAELVLGYLDAWQQHSALQRVHSTAVWLPLQDMELLHASLQDGARRAREKGYDADAAVLGGIAERMQEKLKQHMDGVKVAWGQLQSK